MTCGGRRDVDARQVRRRMVQRVERQVDAGRNGAADIGAVMRHHIQRRRRAEIDDDQLAAIAVEGGDGVDQPVRADLGRVVDADLAGQPAALLADHQRAGVEVPVAENPQVEQRRRRGVRDDDRVDEERAEPVVLHQLAQPDEVLVGGAHALGVAAPLADERFAVMQGEHRVGVADIDRQQHQPASRKKTSPAAIRRGPSAVSRTSAPSASIALKRPVSVPRGRRASIT